MATKAARTTPGLCPCKPAGAGVVRGQEEEQGGKGQVVQISLVLTEQVVSEEGNVVAQQTRQPPLRAEHGGDDAIDDGASADPRMVEHELRPAFEAPPGRHAGLGDAPAGDDAALARRAVLATKLDERLERARPRADR